MLKLWLGLYGIREAEDNGAKLERVEGFLRTVVNMPSKVKLFTKSKSCYENAIDSCNVFPKKDNVSTVLPIRSSSELLWGIPYGPDDRKQPGPHAAAALLSCHRFRFNVIMNETIVL